MRHRWGVGSLGDTGRCEARARQRPRETPPPGSSYCALRSCPDCTIIHTPLVAAPCDSRYSLHRKAVRATTRTHKTETVNRAPGAGRPSRPPAPPHRGHRHAPPAPPAWAMQQLLGNCPLSEAAPRRALSTRTRSRTRRARPCGPWTNVHTARGGCPGSQSAVFFSVSGFSHTDTLGHIHETNIYIGSLPRTRRI